MSVSYELKKDIISQQYKSACCRRSLLMGILFAKGKIKEKEILLSFERAEFAEFTASLILEFYSKEAKIFRSEKGGRCVQLTFDSASASKYIANLNDLPNDFTVCNLITQKCRACLSSFLRGVFIASGRLSDPKKQFSLEFTLGERADAFSKILTDLTLTPHISRRQRGDVVYFRNSYEIEDFYGYAAINHTVFDIIEAKINSLARRESQRFLNCVTNNYKRMADVSERQIAVIEKLDELNLLSSLPDELARTARLRLDYPDLPLSALASKMTPAISKSGLSHRLKNIEELGAKLLGTDTKK
ncbi:MAG: DNA-binding protein WhiA [Ruminococcaceae bacterium]|nr:DNA-binding protein WhiA [Oscillospiraceae bacterium]